MAAKLKFTDPLRPALLRVKSKCLEEVSTSDGIRRVNGFFSELESAAQTLEATFSEQSRFENVQQLLPSRDMVARALRKMHQKIIRRLHVKLKLANPWFGEFSMDLPAEVFSCLSEGILWPRIQRNKKSAHLQDKRYSKSEIFVCKDGYRRCSGGQKQCFEKGVSGFIGKV